MPARTARYGKPRLWAAITRQQTPKLRSLSGNWSKKENDRNIGEMKHLESNIQRSFVRWFRLQYPEYALNLTSVPNGGLRSKTEAAIMKAEGMTAGAADLLLLVPRDGFGALGLEFKTQVKGSRQTPAQKQWQKSFEQVGNKYVLVRTLNEAITAVQNYLDK